MSLSDMHMETIDIVPPEVYKNKGIMYTDEVIKKEV
jgi:hypothetical protein